MNITKEEIFKISAMTEMPPEESSYYDRKMVWDPEAKTWGFETDKDVFLKREVMGIIYQKKLFDQKEEKAVIVETDKFHPIDWFVYGSKTKKLDCVVEIKSRSHHSETFPEGTFFNLRKYSALIFASRHFSIPSYYMIRYTDCVKMVLVSEVDASKIKKNAGCKRYVKSYNDVEDCILLPPRSMTVLHKF